MAGINFEDALEVRGSEIERPKLPPAGTYRWTVEKIPEIQRNQFDNRYDVIDFHLKALEPQEDVDADALGEYGPITSLRLRHRFLFDKNDQAAFDRTLFQMKTFLVEHLGVEDNDALKVMLNSAVNHQCLASIVWKVDKNDPNLFHANIGKTAPLG